MKKTITLKNGLKAILHMEKSAYDFHIYATAGSSTKVALCTFNLSFKVEKTLTDQQRLIYAKKHNIPFEKCPEKIYKVINNKKIEKSNGKLLKTKSGKMYKVSETFCQLAKIEIIDEKFYKVGLGSAMIKAMENIIAKYNCAHIEGLFAPYGRFQGGTEIFYDRHNFKIIEDSELFGIRYLYKKCQTKLLTNER